MKMLICSISIERAVEIPFILNGKMVKLVEDPLQSAVAAVWKEGNQKINKLKWL
ncbi:hypothetical protein ACSS6N_10315 [Peribacillus frigoritolerans]|uniref:hypothetical protein n=1 Tax=Peribacillus frigoritolerans TaxID=450367 RepID=UPI003F85F5D7